MNWLITGGCGFIGSALVARLHGEGASMRVVDNLSTGKRSALPDGTNAVDSGGNGAGPEWAGCQVMIADIRDAAAALRAADGADVIVHLAANAGVMSSIADPAFDCAVNVVGTLNYLEAARKNRVGRFVFASSAAPLGDHAPPLHENLPPRPKSPYGASKLSGEGYCSAYFHTFAIETVALRFGNVYGPGSAHKDSVVAAFLKRALAGKPLEVYGDGDQSRDFVFVDDLIEAIFRAATRPGIGGEVIQIATQTESTVNELAALITEVVRHGTGRTIGLKHHPERAGEVRRSFAAISKAARLLDFMPRIALEEGVRRTFDYFRQAGEVGYSGTHHGQV